VQAEVGADPTYRQRRCDWQSLCGGRQLGQAVCALVILRESAVETGCDDGDELTQKLRNHVAKEIEAIAKPRRIMVFPELPTPDPP
jgi:hypothetical protein